MCRKIAKLTMVLGQTMFYLLPYSHAAWEGGLEKHQMHVSGVLDSALRSKTCALVAGVALVAQIALEDSRPLPHKWKRLALSASMSVSLILLCLIRESVSRTWHAGCTVVCIGSSLLLCMEICRCQSEISAKCRICTNGTVALAVLAVVFGSWQMLCICHVLRLPALVLAVAEVCMSATFTAVVLHGDTNTNCATETVAEYNKRAWKVE